MRGERFRVRSERTRDSRRHRGRELLAIVVLGGAVVSCSGALQSATPGEPTASPGSSATVTPTTTPSQSPEPTATVVPTTAGVVIQVHFSAPAGDPCTDLAPVERTVEEATPEAALRALLAGPTDAERAAGFTSLFSAATADALASVTVVEGVATVSFRDLRTIIPGASSSCGSSAFLTALDRTVLRLPGIERARYSIEGDEAAFWEWLQRDVPDR